MNLTKTVALASLLTSATLASTGVLAHEAGSWLVRGGLGTVIPQESSDDVAGSGELEIDDNTQIAATLSYMFTDNIGFEVLAATPFTHEVKTNGLGKIAEVSHLPPSFMAQYYFGQADSEIRPYLGAGLNYTVFFDEESYGAIKGSDVELDDSFGLAAQAGIDVSINDKWFANASIWYIDIDTTVKVKGVGNFDTEIDPIVAMISAGYTF
ncbi:OmpW family outer membrane protein [Marinomonas mediterranea]|uniref:OmpW family outer membrane protein n=1 Tax=Marinomonas mediterranea TaxID=119864 RepID=UPI002349CA67|nr:OmpW family outer membrane protein [Marinomonas mediterranea]WCN08422.1 outer membrane beta-barrel protein [Marinomonas mediterranea]WCN12476.1 outer membrane beta-barrel protein [Marinomonas mediterranea]